jgi:hypothetical protein
MWLNDPDQLRECRLYEWQKRTVQCWVAWFDENGSDDQNAVDGPPNGSALVYVGSGRAGCVAITGYTFLVPNRGLLTVFNSDVVYGLREIS